MSEPLKLVPRPNAPGNKGVIDCLERLLHDAKKGRLSAIAIAAIDDDRWIYTNFCDAHDRAALVGALEYVKFRILEKMRNE